MFEFLSFLFFSFFAGVGAEGSAFFLSYIFLGIVQMYRYHNILKAYAGSLA